MLDKRLAFIMLVLSLATALPHFAAAEDIDLASTVTRRPFVQQVEKIDIGSQGATITLAGGTKLTLDLGDLIKARGGDGFNYLGAGLALFGLSVLLRLLSMVMRVAAPFGALANRRRRRRDDGDRD